MVFSRLWYLVLSLAIAGAVFLLYIASAVANRNEERTGAKLLTAASHAASFYLKDDARNREATLLPLALDGAVKEALKKSSGSTNPKALSKELRSKAAEALRKFRETPREGLEFDAVWAIDVHGRVVANDNFERGTSSEGFEMGGYSVVADALHGWTRDDTWLFGDDLWRVVARPVEVEVEGVPVGAVVGGRKVDERYAQAVSERIGAPVVFYAAGKRLSRGVPTSTADRGLLDIEAAVLSEVQEDDDYQAVGRTKSRLLRKDSSYDLRAIFARLPGEASELGAGYAVVHKQETIRSPLDFYGLRIPEDMGEVPVIALILAALAAALVGVAFSLVEHSAPLAAFSRAVADLANPKSATDVLKPSTFRGAYRKLAAHVNDGLDKVASASGVERGPADLQSVLGPLPAEPQMSAFSVPERSSSKPASQPRPRALEKGAPEKAAPEKAAPEKGAPEKGATSPTRKLPKAPSAQREPLPPTEEEDEATTDIEREPEPPAEDAATLVSAIKGEPAEPSDGDDSSVTTEPASDPAPSPPAPPRRPKAPARPAPKQPARPSSDRTPAPPIAAKATSDHERARSDEPRSEEAEWRQVYADFLAMKKKLGEPTDRLTYEKFRGTLQRNKEALIARHACTRVSFRVYEKDGRAALKASPVK